MIKLNLFKTLILMALAIGLISLINYQIIAFWFGKNGPANIGSIEVSYVTMGRFLSDFGFPSWAPFWYLGFPFHVFYTPLLPFLEAFLHQLLGVDLWVSYRFLTGLAFILAPLGLFLFAWQLTGRISAGVLSSIVYSVGPTIFYFILPSGEVAADRISTEFWDPRRLTILVRWGEGPHLLSLVFLPLVGVFFDRFLKRKNFPNLLLTSIFLGLTALTNAIGFFSGILLLLSMSFAKFALAGENKLWGFRALFLVGLLCFGLISFWYNITFIQTFFKEGSSSGALLRSLLPWGFLLGVLAIMILYFLIRRLLKDFAISASFLWFGILFWVVATHYLSAPYNESFFRIDLLPQALRYNTEVDLSLALFLGVVLAKALNLLAYKSGLIYVLEVVLTMVILTAAFFYIQPLLKTAQIATAQMVNLEETAEKKIALWLKDHVDLEKGERIFVPGNYGFYLNYFSDIWQLRGGLFQASTNFWPDHIYYQLTNGTSAEIAMAWLKIINAKYAVITTASSKEIYKEIKNPAKFSSEAVFQSEGDIIYQVPLTKPSLAKAVNLESAKGLKPPKQADDKERLLAYQKWLETSGTGEVSFKMIDLSTYQIKGTLNPGEGILVQMTADSGWRAKDLLSKKGVRVDHDPMGYLLLYPKDGEVEIILRHGKSLQVLLGYVISILTLVGILYFYLLKKLKKKINLRRF